MDSFEDIVTNNITKLDVDFIKELVELLDKMVVKYGHNPDYFDKNRIHIFCKHGDVDVLDYVINKFNVTKQNIISNDNLSMRMACLMGHNHIMSYLRQRFEMTKDDINDYLSEILKELCENGELDIIKCLHDEFMIFADKTISNKVVMLGCLYGNLHIVKYIINEHKLTFDDIINYAECPAYLFTLDECTAFTLACTKNYIDIVEYMIDVYQLTKDDIKSDNWLVFRQTIFHEQVDMVKYLIVRLGLTKEDFQQNDYYILRLICKYENIELIKVCMETMQLDYNDIDMLSDGNKNIMKHIRSENQNKAIEIIKMLAEKHKLHIIIN